MEIRDGRGDHRSRLRAENTDKVKAFFAENKKSTRKECGEALGISQGTVRRALKDISEQARCRR